MDATALTKCPLGYVVLRTLSEANGKKPYRSGGVLCHMDNVLIFDCSKEEHDVQLEAALRKIQAAGVTLNPTKC